METNLNEELLDIEGNLMEIKSNLVILQQAVQNEFNKATLEDIDNNLELIINTFDKVLDKTKKFESKINAQLQGRLYKNCMSPVIKHIE